VVKPETSVVATSKCTQRAVRGARGRHVHKGEMGTWETPNGFGESEGLIVVMKRGNARGAKGP